MDNRAAALVMNEIDAAIKACNTLEQELLNWERRYNYITQLVRDRSRENPIGGRSGWLRTVAAGTTPEWSFGSPAPAGCPFQTETIPLQRDESWKQQKVTVTIPLSLHPPHILLGYTVYPRRPGSNGWWKTNGAMLLRSANCHFTAYSLALKGKRSESIA